MLTMVVFAAGAISALWLSRPREEPANNSSADRLAAAQNAYARGDLTSAVNLTREILMSQPMNADALRLLARALVYRSYSEYNRAVDRQLALQVTSDAVQRAPSNLEVLAAHAFVLQAAQKPAEAADAARRVLEENPNHALARTALALAYAVAGSSEIALRESLVAVQNARRDDDAVDALRALAISYADAGNYDEAIRTIEQAMRFNDKLLALYFERALYAMQIGDPDSATVAYYQVLVYDPNNIKARFRLCELSSLLREHDAAVRYCTEVIERAPGWADGWYQLGREYFLHGEFRQAQQHLRQCARLQVMQNVPVPERRFECWYLQGQAAQIIGDCAGLLATYNEFRAMAANQAIQQTWVYPPEGPPGCVAESASPIDTR